LPDPDVVLEARSELWHVDRVTLNTTTSDVLVGEDGLIFLDQAQVFYDSVTLSFGETPLRQVNVTGTVSWTQAASATGLDVSPYLGFNDGDEGVHVPPFKPGNTWIWTFTGEGLVKQWPQPGTSIGGGWAVAAGSYAKFTSGGGRVYIKATPTIQEGKIID